MHRMFTASCATLALAASLLGTSARAEVSEFAIMDLEGAWVSGNDASLFLRQRTDHWTLTFAEFASVLLARCNEVDGIMRCEGSGHDAEGRDFSYTGSITTGSVTVERGDGTALRDDWVIRYRQKEGAGVNTLRGQTIFTRPGNSINARYAHKHFVADEDAVIKP